MRGLAVLLALILAAACSIKLGKDGRSDTTVDVKYLAKTEVDRIADTNRAEVVDGLLLIADKHYKRNPKEWKRAGQASREAAVERLRNRHFQRSPEMNGLRDVDISGAPGTQWGEPRVGPVRPRLNWKIEKIG